MITGQMHSRVGVSASGLRENMKNPATASPNEKKEIEHKVVIRKKHVRASNCHDFQWSRGLWRDASRRIIATAMLCLVFYTTAASCLAYSDGVRGVDIPYFIAACVTTVGIGDISPQSQAHRAASVILLPFGLMIITLFLAALEASENAKVLKKDPFDKYDDDDEGWSIQEIRAWRSKKILESWETKKKGHAASMRKRLGVILLCYIAVLCFGSSFFLLNDRERRLQERGGEDTTVVDAFFFASVIASSVGYGHRIVPQTIAAKGFLTFYFFSAVVVGTFVGRLVNITFETNQMIVENEIVRATTWLHRTALLTKDTDKVSEADYIIFKLLQLQRVDEDILHRLQTRFLLLDHQRSGHLEIGVEIPSAEQVAVMKEDAAKAGKNADVKWFTKQWSTKRSQLIMESMRGRVDTEREIRVKRASSRRMTENTLGFPDQMAPVMLVPIQPNFCAMSKGGALELSIRHPELAPLEPALKAAADLRTEKSCLMELSPLSAMTLDLQAREKASLPFEAVTFAFAFPMCLDMSLVDPKAELSSGPCLLPISGGFVYFDKHRNVVAINGIVAAPPKESRAKYAPVLKFGKPVELPAISIEELSDRWHPITLPFLQELGAVAFTWINRGESVPGMARTVDGAFAYVMKGGYSVYFPIRESTSEVRYKVSEVHDFSYSRSLWFQVFKDTVRKFAFYLLAYILLGYFAICKIEGWDAPTSWYFLSTTFTTVGYGDYAPTKQLTRAIAIGLLPLGLITVGLAISAAQAHKLSKPALDAEEDPVSAMLKILDPVEKNKKLEDLVIEHAAFFDVDNDGKIDREELAQMAPALELSPEEADELFDKLDVYKLGYLKTRPKQINPFHSIYSRILLQCFKVYCPVLLAATFFKVPAFSEALFDRSHAQTDLTWTDCFYFATVTVTTVGFGDIYPLTSGGQIFFAVFIVLTCVWVALVLDQLIFIYVKDYIGEKIVKKIVSSTTFVHKCDIGGDKTISMPQYLLFKLQQLQMVDKKILDILTARFDEIDTDNDLALDVGTDIPSAEQVAQLTEEVAWWGSTNRTVMDAWEQLQEKRTREKAVKTKYARLKEAWTCDEEDDDHDDIMQGPLSAPPHIPKGGSQSSRDSGASLANPIRKRLPSNSNASASYSTGSKSDPGPDRSLASSAKASGSNASSSTASSQNSVASASPDQRLTLGVIRNARYEETKGTVDSPSPALEPGLV